MTLAQVIDLGFDDATKTGRYIKVKCSQCASSAINGIPCHEHGCPNQTFECLGCNARVSRRRQYCEDCQ